MHRKILIASILITVIFTAFSCRTASTVREDQKSFAHKSIENYTFDFNSDLIDRVGVPPEFVLSYFSNADNMPEYLPYMPTEEEMTIIEKELGLLPEIHRQILRDRLIGIYFIKNFLGSGLADYVTGEGNSIYTILVFNPLVLQYSLSEYVSYKENSCFIRDNSSTRVEIELSNEYSGFLYILLHESTHCIDYVGRFTPWVEPSLLELQGASQRDAAFSREVWKDYSYLNPSFDFPFKDGITFYGFDNGPRIEITDAAKVYRALEKSPFVSLHSSFNWAEDFAEYVTFLYMTQHLNLDYRIVIRRNDGAIYRYEPMSSERVIARSGLLDKELAKLLIFIP